MENLSNIKPRDFKNSDLERTTKMMAESFLDEDLSRYRYKPNIYGATKYFKKDINECDFLRFYVVEYDGDIVGCGGLETKNADAKGNKRDDCKRLELRLLFVDPKFKGNGIGYALLEKIKKDAIDTGEK